MHHLNLRDTHLEDNRLLQANRLMYLIVCHFNLNSMYYMVSLYGMFNSGFPA